MMEVRIAVCKGGSVVERAIRPVVAECLAALPLVLASCTGGGALHREPMPPSISSNVIVPDVVGLDPSAAETILENANLAIDRSVITGTYVDAAVIRERPKAGTTVEPGASVRLVIGPACDKLEGVCKEKYPRGAS
jgi:hypothetical protein